MFLIKQVHNDDVEKSNISGAVNVSKCISLEKSNDISDTDVVQSLSDIHKESYVKKRFS